MTALRRKCVKKTLPEDRIWNVTELTLGGHKKNLRWEEIRTAGEPNSICSVTKAKGKFFKERLNIAGRQHAGFGNREITAQLSIGIRSRSWILSIIVEYNTTHFLEQMVYLNYIWNMNTNKTSKKTLKTVWMIVCYNDDHHSHSWTLPNASFSRKR